MGYMKIKNFKKDKSICDIFRYVYVMEKIHGTSATIKFKFDNKRNLSIEYFGGCVEPKTFKNLFDEEKLIEAASKYKNNPKIRAVTIFGEAYGGNIQKTRHVYGDEIKFIAFEFKINDEWLNVTHAESCVKAFGLRFVHYWEVCTESDAAMLNSLLQKPSQEGLRLGLGEQIPEGVVIRPPVEVLKPNGDRYLVKIRLPEFEERLSVQKSKSLSDVEEKSLREDVSKLSEEFVTANRLMHVLDDIKSERVSDGGSGVFTNRDVGIVISSFLNDLIVEEPDFFSGVFDDENKKKRKYLSSNIYNLFMDHLRKNM